MIERLNGRVAIAVAAAGLLLVALVGWFGVVSPQRSKASELDAKITESQTALALAESLNRADARRASSVANHPRRSLIPHLYLVARSSSSWM